MQDEEVIILSIFSIVALIGFLYERHWRRNCRQLRERRKEGHGIEVSEVTSRVQAARRNFTREAHAHAELAERHGELVSAARRVVAEKPYFKHREGWCETWLEDGAQPELP